MKQRIFYGWVIVGTAFMMMPIVFGSRLGFSVFYAALLEDFGWQRGDTALVWTVSLIVFTVSSTLVGMLFDRFGSPRMFALGGLLLAVGLGLSSRINELWQLMLTWGGLAGLGFTVMGMGQVSAMLSRWFVRRRGLAVGVTFAGIGMGTAIMTPLIESVITCCGWRTAYLMLAGLALLVVPLALLLLDHRPQDRDLQPDGDSLAAIQQQPSVGSWTFAAALRSPAFWLLFAAGVGTMGPLRMVTIHQITALVDAGLTRAFAAQVVGLSGVAVAVSYIGFGLLSDRIGRPMAFAIGSACLSAAVVMLAAGVTMRPLLILYAILVGFGEGSRGSLLLASTNDLFPGPAMNTISATIAASMSLGAAFFPWFAGAMFDVQGSYTFVFSIGIVVIVIATLLLWLAPRLLTPAEADHTPPH